MVGGWSSGWKISSSGHRAGNLVVESGETMEKTGSVVDSMSDLLSGMVESYPARRLGHAEQLLTHELNRHHRQNDLTPSWQHFEMISGVGVLNWISTQVQPIHEVQRQIWCSREFLDSMGNRLRQFVPRCYETHQRIESENAEYIHSNLKRKQLHSEYNED
jgi:hypothetical protein